MEPKKIFLNGLLLPLFLVAASASAEVVVIVSASSAITRLTHEQVTRIFLGKTDTFPNGSHVVPIDQSEGNAARDEFYSKVAKKNSSQLAAYWAKIIFTGDGRPPNLLGSNVAVRNAVADNPNVIGYIDKSAVDSSVRVILEP